MYGACCGKVPGRNAASGTLCSRAGAADALAFYRTFATGDATYLLASWHPSTRPATLELEDDIRWYRLDDILGASGGRLMRPVRWSSLRITVRCRVSPCGGAGEGAACMSWRFGKVNTWLYVDGDVR